MSIYGPFSTAASTGGAGTSTATVTTPTRLTGELKAVYIQYNDSPPATTDVTVKTQGTSPAAPSITFLTRTDTATGGWFYPRAKFTT